MKLILEKFKQGTDGFEVEVTTCNKGKEMRNVYKIEATTITGCLAHDFIRKQFRSIKSAVAAFDAIYDRKGFRIVVWKQIIEKDGDYSCVEYICAKIVKSTFR